MASVSALDTILSGQTAYSTDSKNDTGIDTFLTMLVAQLKNQDPLNPMEGSDFAVQLAQFTALEQQFKSNDYLESIDGALNMQEAGDLFDYIGKTVKTNDNIVSIKDGNMDSTAYTLADRADVSVTITNADGLVVRRLYKGWQDEGTYDLDWDGRDEKGELVEDGAYLFEVSAVNETGGSVALLTSVTGEVTGVTYQGGYPYLMVGEQLVSPTNVIEITEQKVEDANSND